MSDLTTSETNEVDASNDSLLLSEMKSNNNKNLNNCDETDENIDTKLSSEEKHCDIEEDGIKPAENGHSVDDAANEDEDDAVDEGDGKSDGQTNVATDETTEESPTDDVLVKTNGNDPDDSSIANDTNDDSSSVNNNTNGNSEEVSSLEIDSESSAPLNEEPEDDKNKDETISDKIDLDVPSVDQDSASSSSDLIKESPDLASDNGEEETTNDESIDSCVPSLTASSEDKQTEDEPTLSSCVKEDDEEEEESSTTDNVDSVESEEAVPVSLVKKTDDEKAESFDLTKMEVDSIDDIKDESSKISETDSSLPSPPANSTTSDNVVTEVVVGDKDEVTLDLSKTVTNGVKDSSSNTRQPLSDNISNTKKQNKREHSKVTPHAAPEDLTLPTKRRAYANGDLNGSVSNDDDEIEEDLKMPPTPPHDDNDDLEEHLQKLKLIRFLKQELLNEEMKLVLLKKIRQSQLKENISQNNAVSADNTATTNNKNTTPSIVQAAATAATPTTPAINLPPSLRDLNILASYQASLAQAGINSALNFSNAQNSAKMSPSNLVNNNVAHSNKAQSIYNSSKNSYHNLNHAHQTPMQAHMPSKASIHGMSHGKANSGMNSPFTPSLGRSPYNHLNSHLSAPPPSIHGANSSSSSKQRHSAASFDAHNLNAAHSSHRSSSTSHSSSSHGRSSISTPPNLAHGYQQQEIRQPTTSSKHNQHISHSASSSPVLHNQISESIRDPLLAQRQAANVKQVLRKQLEKMPQPKIPPPEMHFIPNPSNPEFICYVGLENVVDYLTGNNQTRQPPEPFECVQCGTDYTPVWKWQDRRDPSRPQVICEKCVSKNMKKLVSDEHNKRISTFSKAYEELEKQLATASASLGTITPPTTAKSPSLGPSGSNNSSGQHSSNTNNNSNNNLSSSLLNASGAHNLFGSGNANAAAMAAVAAAAANFGSLGSSLAGLQQQQVHSNSSLSAQQVAAMAASFMPQSSNTGTSGHSMSIPPAAHSSSSRSTSSSNFSANLANAFAASNASQSVNSAAQSNAALAFLQQLPKMNSNQSLLLAQQLQALTAFTGAANSNANNAAMQQMLGFPNFLYSSLLAASFANQNKSSSNSLSSNSSSMNAASAAAAAGLQRQFLEMASNVGNGGHSRSSGGGHSSNSGSSSMQHNNWKS